MQHAIERVGRPGGSHEGVGRKKNQWLPDDCNAMFQAQGGDAWATSAGASNLGWLLRGTLFDDDPCMGSAAVLATVSSSNQGRKDLTRMAVLELWHLISSRRSLWCTGGTIQAGMNTCSWHSTLHWHQFKHCSDSPPRGAVGIAALLCRCQTAGGASIPRWSASKAQDRRPAERQQARTKRKCLNSAVMHRTWPSMVLVLMNDSVLSSDAATLRRQSSWGWSGFEYVPGRH